MSSSPYSLRKPGYVDTVRLDAMISEVCEGFAVEDPIEAHRLTREHEEATEALVATTQKASVAAQRLERLVRRKDTPRAFRAVLEALPKTHPPPAPGETDRPPRE